ncbi:MAG: hypothetical protein HC815_30880 [Richelia sp. RM1_1_1]|nr:hypothetical protein [Richelia sp. RM1_1_1]
MTVGFAKKEKKDWKNVRIAGFGFDSEGVQHKVSVINNGRITTISSFKNKDCGEIGETRSVSEGDNTVTFYYHGLSESGSVALWKNFPPKGTIKASSPIRESKKLENQHKAQQAKKQQKQEQEKEIILPAHEINFWFERIRKLAGLAEEHKHYLLSRGFNQKDIDRNKYFSWNKAIRSKIERNLRDSKVPQGFPGWDAASKTIEVYAESAIVCPAFDFRGVITGAQLRHIGHPTKRYTWWSFSKLGGTKSFDFNGKETQPIDFARPEEKAGRKSESARDRANSVLLVEGFLKSSLTAAKHDIRAIGAAGFNFASTDVKPLLVDYLSKARRESPNPSEFKVIIPPDAGAVMNSQISGKITRTIEFLQNKQNNFKVEIYWYGQYDKPLTKYQESKTGDIDEIATRFSKSRYISVKEFKNIVESGAKRREIEKKIEGQTDIKEHCKTSNGWKVKNINQRYISSALHWDKLSGLVGIKSAMSTGKTESFKNLVTANENPSDQLAPKKTVLLGSRNALLIQTSQRAGFTHLQSNPNAKIFGVDKIDSLSLCVDSLMHLDPKHYSKAAIVIDEAETVLPHLLTGGTCSSKRTHLVHRLFSILGTVIESGGLVTLADANLSARTLRFFEEAIAFATSAEYKKTMIVNQYKAAGTVWDITFFNGSIKTDKQGKIKTLTGDSSPMLQTMRDLLLTNQNIYIACDSKKDALGLQKLFEETVFAGQEATGNSEGKHGLAITSDDLGEDEIAFLKNPEKFLSENPWVRYICASPTVESGVSVEGEHFDAVFGLFRGTTSTSLSQMQALGRVRKPAPRFIFAEVRARGRCNANTFDSSKASYKDFFPELLTNRVAAEVAANYERCAIEQKLQTVSDSMTKVQARLALNDISFKQVENKETGDVETLENDWSRAYEEQSIITRYTAEILAAENWNKSNTRKDLLKLLSSCGHTIKVQDEAGEAEAIKAHLSLCKKEVEDEQAQKVSSAKVIDIKTAQLYRESPVLTPEQKSQVERAFLQNELPDVEITKQVTLDCLIRNNGTWFKQIKAIAQIQNPQMVADIEAAKIFYRLFPARFEQAIELSLFDIPVTARKASQFNALGVADFVADPEKVWTGKELKEILKRFKFNSYQYRNIGLFSKAYELTDNSAFQYCNDLLEKTNTGLQLQEMGEGLYRLDSEDNFDDVQWRRCYEAYLKHLKEKAINDTESMQNSITKVNQKNSS